MKIYHLGLLSAGFALVLLCSPSQLKAESFNEISLPAVISSDLSSGSREFLKISPVQFSLTKADAENFLFELGISIKEKPAARKWDPFKAARILQTSA